MRDRRLIGRIASLFAAGFVATAALVGSAGSLVAFSLPSVAASFASGAGAIVTSIGMRVAGTVAVESLLSVVGGAAVALYFGRNKSE